MTKTPDDLLLEILTKYMEDMTPEAARDISIVIDESYKDGYCRGHSDATNEESSTDGEWWSAQDVDESWIKEHNDPGIDDLIQYCEAMPPALLEQVRHLTEGVDVDLDLPLNPWDEVEEDKDE